MPMPSRSPKQHKQIIEYYERALREGGRPFRMFGPGKSAMEMAANFSVDDGLFRTASGYRNAYDSAIKAGFIPDETIYVPPRYHQAAPQKTIEPARQIKTSNTEPDCDGEWVLIIPDTHMDPRQPHRIDVFKWIARLGSDRKLPRVIHLGDWSTWDSVSKHDTRDTAKGQLRPTITADQDNLEQSLAAWQAAKQDWRPKQHVMLGNHEYRLWRKENDDPDAGEVFTRALEQAFTQFGWRTSPFGEIRYVEGVAFTHHLTNGIGRAFGGKTGVSRAANEVGCSAIMGHTHHWKFWSAAKIGPMSGVDVLEAGCALPYGEIEEFAKHSLNDWWYGVTIAKLRAGRIEDFERVSMLTLRDKYSDDGADIR